MAPDPSVIAGIDLFQGIDQRSLADIVRHGRTHRIAKGGVIFRRGDKAKACHALISGRVRIGQSAAPGDHLLIRYVGSAEVFGAVALFHGGRFPADATAVTDCVEVIWSAAAMMDLMQRYPRIALNALRIVGRRLDEMQTRIRELVSERAEQRIANTLTRLASQAGRTTAAGTEIAFPLSRKDIAAMTGTTVYTVSRLLSEWQSRGIVASTRKHITIRDMKRLNAVTAGETER
jgi:CRP-like cAMP-binding protein